jgi:phosphate starvation-inducible protein PhoH and related proteins
MAENTDKRVPKSSVKFSISLSTEQKEAKEKILTHPYNFILGEAGTGKTLLAIQIALDKYFKREINKIVITRPTVSSEQNGFLPGSIKEKLEPWLVPIMDNIRKVYSKENIIEKMLADTAIEIISLSHFRGITIDKAVCIVDECQNLTTEQMAMCIGRLGKESQMIFCGDSKQIDLKNYYESGLSKINKLKDSKFVNIIELTENHRHPALKEVLSLYYL